MTQATLERVEKAVDYAGLHIILQPVEEHPELIVPETSVESLPIEFVQTRLPWWFSYSTQFSSLAAQERLRKYHERFTPNTTKNHIAATHHQLSFIDYLRTKKQRLIDWK